jgi:hypothetical protein
VESLAVDTASMKSVEPVATTMSPPVAPRVGPSKEVARLSADLEGLLREAQMREKAPNGMLKCPACGAILAPTRDRRLRTHDDPVKGVRCDASRTPAPGAKASPGKVGKPPKAAKAGKPAKAARPAKPSQAAAPAKPPARRKP